MNRIGFRFTPESLPPNYGNAITGAPRMSGIEFLVDGKSIVPETLNANNWLTFVGIANVPGSDPHLYRKQIALMQCDREVTMGFGFVSDEPGNPVLVPLMAYCCWFDPYEGHLVCRISVEKDVVTWSNFRQVVVDTSQTDDHSVVIPFKEMDEPFCETPKAEFIFDRKQYESAFTALAEFFEKHEKNLTELQLVKNRLFRAPKLKDYKEATSRGVEFSEEEFKGFLAENNLS